MTDLYHNGKWLLRTTENGLMFNLNRYTILYCSIPHPMVIDVEASGVKMHQGVITFYDQYGEDEAVFDEQDILRITKHE